MKKILHTLFDSIFILLFARRAARNLRMNLPRLGMVEGEVLILPAQGRTSGIVTLSGFGLPKFKFEMFLKVKGGWKGHAFTMGIDDRDRLWLQTEGGIEILSYCDKRAAPVVRVLKSTLLDFPFSIFMTATPDKVAAKTPQVVF